MAKNEEKPYSTYLKPISPRHFLNPKLQLLKHNKLLPFQNYCCTLTNPDCYFKNNNHSQTSISQLLPIPIVSSNEINVFFKGLNYSVKFDDPLVTNSVALWWTAKIKWFVSHNITIEETRTTQQCTPGIY